MKDEEVYELARQIYMSIKENFETIHLSGNLVDTMKIVRTDNGYKIEIPADKYIMDLFIKQGVLIYNGKGSYAVQVDREGGLSGKHKNYVSKAIDEGISNWQGLLGVEIRRGETQ